MRNTSNIAIVATVVAILISTPAHATQTVPVPDNFRDIVVNINVLFERCMGAISLRAADNSACVAVQNFIQQLNSLPMTPVPEAKPEEKKPEAAAPEKK